jgi:hypothetical protein
MSCHYNCDQGRRCTCRKDDWTAADRVLSTIVWIVTALVCLVAFTRYIVV